MDDKTHHHHEPFYSKKLAPANPDRRICVFRPICHGQQVSAMGTYFPVSRYHTHSNPRKLMVDLNPRYVSKLSHSSGRHAAPDSAHRLRPYFLSRRKRTKSENADTAAAAGDGLQLAAPAAAAGVPQLPTSSFSSDWFSFTVLGGVNQQQQQHGGHQNGHGAGGMMDSNDGMTSMMSEGHQPTGGAGAQTDRLTPTAAAAAAASPIPVLVKSRSLEDLSRSQEDNGGGDDDCPIAMQQSHEMEAMSSRIQEMRVHD